MSTRPLPPASCMYIWHFTFWCHAIKFCILLMKGKSVKSTTIPLLHRQLIRPCCPHFFQSVMRMIYDRAVKSNGRLNNLTHFSHSEVVCAHMHIRVCVCVCVCVCLFVCECVWMHAVVQWNTPYSAACWLHQKIEYKEGCMEKVCHAGAVIEASQAWW